MKDTTVHRNEGGAAWSELAGLDRLAAVLDPADTRGGKNRLIHRVHLRALSRSVGDLRGQRALDFGCGTGRISAWLVQRGAAVDAVDVTSEMLEVARTNVPEGSFHLVDGASLPFEDDRFDIVVSVYVLQYYVARDEGVFQELARVLRPGGRLVAIEQVAEGDIGRGAPARGYRESLAAAGIEVDRIDPIRRSDSRAVGVAARWPSLARLPALDSLAMHEARGVDMSALTGGRYVDALIGGRKP